MEILVMKDQFRWFLIGVLSAEALRLLIETQQRRAYFKILSEEASRVAKKPHLTLVKDPVSPDPA